MFVECVCSEQDAPILDAPVHPNDPFVANLAPADIPTK